MLNAIFVRRKKYSIEEIDELTKDKHYILVSREYISAHENLLWKCLTHNELFWCSWHNLSKIKGCKFCNNENVKSRRRRISPPNKIEYNFQRYLYIIEKKGFSYISGSYVNINSELAFRCEKCGREFLSTMKELSRHGCSRCSRKEQLTPEEISRRISNIPIQLISTQYVNCYQKLDWKCLNCNRTFKMNWVNISNGHGCPDCNKLTGEKNPRWRGGIRSKYPKEFNKTLKEQIRNRDNRNCQYPNCNYNDIGQDEKLHVHHINRDKNNCQPYNLISLCPSHHIEVEDRTEWQDYFYAITADYEA